MFSSPSPTKVIIIIASGKEPVTRHYSKVESHPVSQLLADEEEQKSVHFKWRKQGEKRAEYKSYSKNT